MAEGGLTILTAAAEGWADFASARPLSEYSRQLPDLARRLAVALHIVTAAGGNGALGAEIPAGTVKRAVGLIDGVLAPMARAILGPVSFASAVDADAAAMTVVLRRDTSPQSPLIEKRQWYRACGITSREFDAAVPLLQQLKLVAPAESQKGAWFTATAAVHE